METVKELLNFCNDAVFYGYKNIRIICEMYPVRFFIINRFYKTIPYTRILVILSIIDDTILKNSNNDIEKILDDIHNLGENILYMLSFEKTVKDEQQKVIESNLIDE